jgi:cell division protein FtsW (lipid II flippase)
MMQLTKMPYPKQSERSSLPLFFIAAGFLGLFALALTLAPAARARSWEVAFRWDHWFGYLVWLVGFYFVQRQAKHHLPKQDPILLPVVALISGWGLLTVWRLTPTLGLRQTIWLAIGMTVLVFGFRLPSDLWFLRKYKYIWLTSGVLLTALTLIFGTNPLGYGPRLWLGCCGIYLQPSEPLKLLLVVYLAGYLADWSGFLSLPEGSTNLFDTFLPAKSRDSRDHAPSSTRTTPHIQILVPTLLMTGLAILVLLVQRDLGTATILIFLYSVMVFLATAWWWVPVISVGVITFAGFLGYLFFDVIRLRIDAWINPWLDPAGRSYQIVQSLMAVSNGGIIGRGPGIGNPSLVPIAHSDFIFAAIAEEGGFGGVVCLLSLLALLVYLGMKTAIHAADRFRRYLAGGLTAFLVAQSVLIIGGNLRMLPLTGVTLPLISYGGSSLLVSFLIVLILSHINAKPGTASELAISNTTTSLQRNPSQPVVFLSIFLMVSLFAASVTTGWWVFVRNTALLSRTDNPRRSIADRFVERGSILDRRGTPIVESTGNTGEYQRLVHYPDLSPVVGYSHPVYGQSGLEANLDPILRGIEGNDPFTLWWHHLLYGQPPPGLDIRLTLDLEMQSIADEMLANQIGGLVLMNAENGEILVMSSQPSYDPNRVDEEWERLIQDPQSPLLNRVTQGSYPTGDLISLWPLDLDTNQAIDRAALRLPVVVTDYPNEATILEIALEACALNNEGVLPAPSLAQLMRNPNGGWLLLSPLSSPVLRMTSETAASFVRLQTEPGSLIWQLKHVPDEENLTWYIGGTANEWEGLPLIVVLVLETENRGLAEDIGQAVLAKAMGP